MNDDYIMKIYGWMPKITNSNAELLVLALIYSFHEKGIECNMSNFEIAEWLNIARRSVQRSIKTLKAKGIIKVESNCSDEGTCLANTYCFVSKYIDEEVK